MNWTKSIFEAVNVQLGEQGVLMREGDA